MNALVLSDSHGNARALEAALAEHPDVRDVIFLGDGVRDMDWMEEKHPQRRFYTVKGNCDMGSFLPTEGVIPLDGVLVLYTHGHLYAVKRTLQELTQAALQKNASVALYGHTHIPAQEEHQGVLLCNPGALCGTRGSGPRNPTYGILSIKNGKASFRMKVLPE